LKPESVSLVHDDIVLQVQVVDHFGDLRTNIR
jgi:S-adenosylmethionine hydrolase